MGYKIVTCHPHEKNWALKALLCSIYVQNCHKWFFSKLKMVKCNENIVPIRPNYVKIHKK